MGKLVVDSTNETAVSVNSLPLQQHLEKILERLSDKRDVSIELTIAGEAKVRQLNRDFLHHDYATDVLSFPAPDGVGEDEPRMLGSVIICLPVAQKQAAAAGITFEDELKVLAGHSLLHLLGYHHK
jgi:probable rRNA maturation factor